MGFLRLLVLLIVAAVVLPPAYYALFGDEYLALPAPGRYVALPDGARIHTLEHGAGDPIVLVHGLPGSAYDWAPLYRALQGDGRRVIAYDRIGYGHSSPRAGGTPYGFEENARELIALLEALALERATLVGWSYGGGVVTRAANLDASRIARLVLVASTGPAQRRGEPSAVERALFSPPVLTWVSWVPPVSIGVTEQFSRQAFSSETFPDWWVPQLRANLARRATLDAWLGEGRAGGQSALAPEKLALPVLVIHGTNDQLVNVGVGEDLNERIPNAAFVRVEGGSHMLPITHAELLRDRILAFLRTR